MVDTSRSATYRDGESGPRTIITEIRYPTLSPGVDVTGAPPAKLFGPYPLIIFGHGYAVTPAIYSSLQQSWARAGFVVAAPVFPLENADAPGGPNEADLVNQPADMSFVISRMLAASGSTTSFFSGLLSPTEIAVSGQSDGGDTALAVAYNPTFRDQRVRAAVILSGEEIPGVSGFTFPAGSPPLLATQGTADNINPPARTEEYFAAAQSPKYLLKLLAAEHLPPYTYQEPQLSIVSRVSTDFLRGYLLSRPADIARLPEIGNVPGISTLTAFP
jgi:dienelactone hydrolase